MATSLPLVNYHHPSHYLYSDHSNSNADADAKVGDSCSCHCDDCVDDSDYNRVCVLLCCVDHNDEYITLHVNDAWNGMAWVTKPTTNI